MIDALILWGVILSRQSMIDALKMRCHFKQTWAQFAGASLKNPGQLMLGADNPPARVVPGGSYIHW